MGRIPCACHGERFRGQAFYAYPAIADGGTVQRARLLLCPAGAADYSMELVEHLSVDDLDAVAMHEPLNCAECYQLLEADFGNPIWVTEYLSGTRKDWFARVHRSCTSAIRERLITQFQAERPLPELLDNGTAPPGPIGPEPGKLKKQTFSRAKTRD
jgi:hypothetical protein